MIQRVRYAKVSVNGELIAGIGLGLCVFVGIGNDDAAGDVSYMASKLAGLRVFADAEGKMNLKVSDVGGEFLLISQFTLLGDVRRGNRPSFSRAAVPDVAQRLFDDLVAVLALEPGCPVRTGKFRSHMDVELANDGPVTLLIDSKRQF